MTTNNPGNVFLEDKAALNNCFLGPDIRVGYRSYANDTTIKSRVRIGRYCSIGRHCFIPAGAHKTDWLTTHPVAFEPEYKPKLKAPPGWAPVYTVIGNDVWIGNHVNLTEGVQIGDGAVIGSGAVVTKDVAPYAIVVGVPAQTLRFRFDETTIAELLELKWWDYEESLLLGLPLHDLTSCIALLRERVGSGNYQPLLEHHRLWT